MVEQRDQPVDAPAGIDARHRRYCGGTMYADYK
jgi:hypothetical protein